MDDDFEQRKDELVDAMHEVGLHLRSDSRLAAGYVEGTLAPDWTLEKVVEQLMYCHYLYHFTDYAQWVDLYTKVAISQIAEWCDGDLKTATNLVERSLISHIKSKTQKKFPAPPEYPWLSEEHYER